MKQKSITFLVGKADGEYIAYNDAQPCFCFVGKTRQEVVDTALRAYDVYLRISGETRTTQTPHIAAQVPVKRNQRHVVPEELVYAVA